MLTLRDPEPTPELTGHCAQLQSYCGPEAAAAEITTQEEAQIAADILNDIKTRLQTLKAAEELMTRDFVTGIEKIRALFRPSYEAGQRASLLWKQKLADSVRKRKEETAKALREAQAAVARQDQPAATAAILRVSPVEKVAGVTTRRVWKFEVVDVTKVPQEFLQVNETRVRLAMRDAVAGGEEPSIPGVKFWQEETLAATG